MELAQVSAHESHSRLQALLVLEEDSELLLLLVFDPHARGKLRKLRKSSLGAHHVSIDSAAVIGSYVGRMVSLCQKY